MGIVLLEFSIGRDFGALKGLRWPVIQKQCVAEKCYLYGSTCQGLKGGRREKEGGSLQKDGWDFQP